MKNRFGAYIILLLSLALELFALKYSRVFPELTLMFVVFAGIFFGPFEGVVLGVTAGFLRACFSSGTFGTDMIMFAFIAYVSSVFSVMFYKKNPLFHAVLVLAAFISFLSAQAIFFSAAYGTDIPVVTVLNGSRLQILFTVLTAPFIFPLWCSFLKIEE